MSVNIAQAIKDFLSKLGGSQTYQFGDWSSPAPAQTQIPVQQPVSQPVVQKSMVPQVLAAETPQPVQNTQYGRIPDTARLADPSVQNAINKAVETYNVPKDLLYDIGFSESSLNPKLVNTTPAGRQAGNPTGLFQFTDNTWKQILDQYNNKPGMSLNLPNTDRTDPVTNAMAAAYLIKNGQLGKWDASDWNWGKKYTPQELEKQGFYKQDTTHTPGKFYYQVK